MGGTNRAVAGKTGNILLSKIDGSTDILDDTQTAWIETTTAGSTNDTTTSDGPGASDPTAPPQGVTVGRTTTSAVAAAAIIASRVITPSDLSSQNGLTLYFKTNVAIPAGNLLFQLDDTAALASPIESIALAAVAGDNVGKWIRLDLALSTPSLDTAIVSIGWKFAAAITIDFEIQYYTVRQTREIQGMKNFTVPVSTETLDSTDYQSGLHREHEDSFVGWTLDFGGNKEGAPAVALQTNYVFIARENDVVGRSYIGDGFRTNFSGSAAFDALVEYSFSIQGTGSLQEPVA